MPNVSHLQHHSDLIENRHNPSWLEMSALAHFRARTDKSTTAHSGGNAGSGGASRGAVAFGDEAIARTAHRQKMTGLGRIDFEAFPQPHDEVVHGSGRR